MTPPVASSGLLFFLPVVLVLGACGNGPAEADDVDADESASVEACEQWDAASDSDDATGGRNRAVVAAGGAVSDERFRYLATDMQTYLDASERLRAVDLEGASAVSDDAMVREGEELVAAIEAFDAADDPVYATCDLVGVSLPSVND